MRNIRRQSVTLTDRTIADIVRIACEPLDISLPHTLVCPFACRNLSLRYLSKQGIIIILWVNGI